MVVSNPNIAVVTEQDPTPTFQRYAYGTFGLHPDNLSKFVASIANLACFQERESLNLYSLVIPHSSILGVLHFRYRSLTCCRAYLQKTF